MRLGEQEPQHLRTRGHADECAKTKLDQRRPAQVRRHTDAHLRRSSPERLGIPLYGVGRAVTELACDTFEAGRGQMAAVDRAPAEGPVAQRVVGDHGGEHDQRLEVDGLPVVTARGAFHSELGPKTAQEVAREFRDLVTEVGQVRLRCGFARGAPRIRWRALISSTRRPEHVPGTLAFLVRPAATLSPCAF